MSFVPFRTLDVERSLYDSNCGEMTIFNSEEGMHVYGTLKLDDSGLPAFEYLISTLSDASIRAKAAPSSELSPKLSPKGEMSFLDEPDGLVVEADLFIPETRLSAVFIDDLIAFVAERRLFSKKPHP